MNVPPSFHVSVWYGEKAVPGIPIEVYNNAALYIESAKPMPVLSLQTDQNGNAEIMDLAPGVYLVQTTGPGQGSAVYAHVATNHSKPASEIKLEWPYSREKILSSRTLAGDLISNKPWHPFENIHLELWTAGGSAPLAVADTGPNGHFHFDESRAGIYVLRVRGRQKDISPDNQVEGDVAIELSPSGPDTTEISLRLDMTDCGIVYNNCPASGNKPVAMASRRIQVFNPPGMAEYPTIAGAQYKLLDDRGVSIAEGTTDKNGIAELPTDATGRTTLIVASGLTSTLQQTLDLLTPKAGAPDLAVTLRQVDECSSVSLEKNATPQ
ncbi:MAG TPA: hypothetical protein VJW20_24540 [Candidatus Angelobacter sp.]|nr:hypothetical protein [Candidatus Angelobacter sp.]